MSHERVAGAVMALQLPGGLEKCGSFEQIPGNQELGFSVQLKLDPASEWQQCLLGFGEGAGRLGA